MKIRFWIAFALILSASFLLYRFTNKPDKAFSYLEIRDYIHANGIHPLFQIADTYKYNQDYIASVRAFKEALEKATAKEDREYAFNQLAYIHLTMNEDSAAYTYIQEVEKLSPLSRVEAQADYDYNVGVWAYHTFKPKMAEGYLQKALEGFKHLYGDKHLKVALSWTQLGLLEYKFAPSVDIAQPIILKAYELFKAKDYFEPYSAPCFLAMGLLSYSNWDYQLSDFYCQKAITIIDESLYNNALTKSVALTIIGRNINRNFNNENNYFKKQSLRFSADSIFQLAVELSKNSKSIWQQDILVEQVTNDAKQKDSTIFFKHLKELQNNHESDAKRFGYYERLMGFYYNSKKNYPMAKYWYLSFWKKHHQDSIRDRRLISETCSVLSEFYKTDNQFDSCLYYWKEELLLDLPKQKNTIDWEEIIKPDFYKKIRHPYIVFNHVADALLKDFHVNKNQKSLKRAFNIFKMTDTLVFSNIPSPEDDAILFFKKETLEKTYQNTIECAYEMFKITNDNTILNDGLCFMERTKAFLLYKNMFDYNVIQDDNLKKIIKEIQELSESLNKMKWQKELGVTRAQEYILNTERFNHLYSILEHEYPDIYKSRTQQKIPNLKNIQSLITDTQAFAEYSMTKNSLYLMLIRSKESHFIKLENINEINENIKKFNEELMDKKDVSLSPNAFIKVSYGLYSNIFKPFEKKLTAVKEIIIIPDQSINLVSFEALVTSTNGKNYKELPYLLHKYRFVTTPALRSYKPSIKNENFENILGMSYSKESAELPYSREMDEFEFLFKDKAKILRGSLCSPNNLFKYQSQYDMIHLSLHAASSSTNRRDNKIFFSPNRQTPLYGFELLKFNFVNKLVVLLACESGRGDIITDEGSFSLARYFLQAGAKNVIASLWEIDNATYSTILSHFYKNIVHKNTLTQSLNQSKVTFIKQIDPLKAHPKYWSGLILIR